jgi:2,4-dienoyl-CoA reductase-like NADH-dependent reductase (Old Yellow Enzyme family)
LEIRYFFHPPVGGHPNIYTSPKLQSREPAYYKSLTFQIMDQKFTGKSRYPHLFSPLELGPLKLKNRIGLAPMTRTSAHPDGTATHQMLAYYTRFARGGFSLLISEGVYPDEEYSQGYLNQPGIANVAHISSWKDVTDAVHEAGAAIFCQLMHAGALVQGNRYTDHAIAPSAVAPKGEQLAFYGGTGPYPLPVEITPAGIQTLISGFVKAASNALRAGFDGIEIHGANGYILDQFLTDYTNQRTDQYGGSTENRVRLLAEVVAATRKAIGPEVPLGIRISQSKVNDYTHKWAGGEKDAEIIFTTLAQAGVDFIHVTEHQALKPAFSETGPTLVSLAKKYGQVAVLVNGNLNEPEKAESILADGGADLVTIGKGALANPEWPQKVAWGEELQVFRPENHLSPDARLKPHEL